MPIREKKLYLDPFLDMYNSEILFYRISGEAKCVGYHGSFRGSYLRNGMYLSSNFSLQKGWTYQMKAYSHKLKKNIRSSKVCPVRETCLDNSIIENFLSLLKQEIYYGRDYRIFEELKQAIDGYIHYYNHERMKKETKLAESGAI